MLAGHVCPVPGGMGVPPWGCTGPAHWLMHGLGIDTQTSYFYDFTSGAGPMLLALLLSSGVLFTAVHAYRHWTCQHSLWCIRHGGHELSDPATGETHHYCHKHHPAPRSKRWTWEQRLEVWKRSQTADGGS